MAEYFLDTNVILRHILDDHATFSPAARAIVTAVEEGRITAWTTDLAIAEAVCVLSSRRLYDLSRAAIAAALLPIIGLPTLKLPNKRLYDRVFELFVSSTIDFIDAYHVAMIEARGEIHVLSFDSDFDRFPKLIRHTAVD